MFIYVADAQNLSVILYMKVIFSYDIFWSMAKIKPEKVTLIIISASMATKDTKKSKNLSANFIYQ
jgi:hypothetical protein